MSTENTLKTFEKRIHSKIMLALILVTLLSTLVGFVMGVVGGIRSMEKEAVKNECGHYDANGKFEWTYKESERPE